MASLDRISMDNEVEMYVSGSCIHAKPADDQIFGPNSTILCDYYNQRNQHSPGLKIQNSNISTLQRSTFSSFWDIAFLDLRMNSIRFISSEVFDNLTNLQELYIAANQLTRVSKGVFSYLQELKVLDLSANQIEEIEDLAFVGLDNIKHMYLERNQISNLEGNVFENLHSLQKLKLNNNNIERFQLGTFDSLRNLLILDISHNRLMELESDNFASMANLRVFYFNSNQISFLNVNQLTAYCPKLWAVSLLDNLWECQHLAFIFRHLSQHGVTVSWGQNYEGLNKFVVACKRSEDTGGLEVKEVTPIKNTTSCDGYEEMPFLQQLGNFLRNFLLLITIISVLYCIGRSRRSTEVILPTIISQS